MSCFMDDWLCSVFQVIRYFLDNFLIRKEKSVMFIVCVSLKKAESSQQPSLLELMAYTSSGKLVFKALSSTFPGQGPIYIFHITLRAAVIADYKICMDILNIIMQKGAKGDWDFRISDLVTNIGIMLHPDEYPWCVLNNCLHGSHRVLRNYSFKLIQEVVNIKTNIFHYGAYGAKGHWDFRISDLVKNPDGTDI